MIGICEMQHSLIVCFDAWTLNVHDLRSVQRTVTKISTDQLSSLMTYEFWSQFRTIKVDLPHVRSRMSISALLTTWLSKSPNQLRELAQQDMFASSKRAANTWNSSKAVLLHDSPVTQQVNKHALQQSWNNMGYAHMIYPGQSECIVACTPCRKSLING